MDKKTNEYTDEEMFTEIESFISKLGGNVKCINPSSYLFSIEVREDLQNLANDGIQRIVDKYRLNRAKYLLKNPLERINIIRKDLVSKDIR